MHTLARVPSYVSCAFYAVKALVFGNDSWQKP
jgi:hypothetical protein